MTAMDSDSESQDSDDGRRFRFEATRKDSVAPVNTTDRTKTLKKHKSSHSENYRDRKERPKHESSSKTDDKDLRHSTKHSKHESRNSRQEDSKNSHKDYRESRSGFATNDRGSRNSNGGDARERPRDSKRQLDRDRSVHRPQRSREHSYERNYHDERASSDKHRSRYHERHKHRSRDRSRDRSHQSSRVKSSNDDHRSREDHGRSHDSSRKISVKENRSQNSRDYSSPKNIERERSHSETRSSENTKKDSSIEAQDCKDLDLSQFDVLSETDENMSDGQDSESQTSSPHLHKIKLKGHDSAIRSESRATKRENDDGASESKRREELKVKRRSCDPASSSSNNNPSAVSDSLFGSASYATLLVTREIRMDSEREKSEYREEERMLTCDSVEPSSSREIYSRSNASSGETQLLERNMDQTGSTYGPLLPPRFTSNASDGDKLESETSNIFDENKINDEIDGKNMNFIGPHLPPPLNDRPSVEREDAADAITSTAEADAIFGPALPPHLLQRKRKNDSQDKIIGPVLPGILESCEDLIASPESDDDSAIGPLPVDHPALRTSRVHEQLDLRAQRIRDEKYLVKEVKKIIFFLTFLNFHSQYHALLFWDLNFFSYSCYL